MCAFLGRKLLGSNMPFILMILLKLTSHTAATVIGADVSTSFNDDEIRQCLTINNGLLSTSSAAFTSRYFENGTAPLTWTEAIRLNPNPDSASKNSILVNHEFYFGYPPSSSSGPSTALRACSLFFYDASALYGEEDTSSKAIDWSRELPNNCVANLTTRLDDAARGAVVQSDQDVFSFCRQQQLDLLHYQADSCAGFGVRLTDIKTFTIDPSESGNCSLSTGGGSYNLRLMDMLELSDRNGTSGIKELVQGTTPIITVLFPPSSSSNSEPETHYSALRAERNLLPLVDGSGASRVSPTYFVFLSWVVGIFFSIMEYSRF